MGILTNDPVRLYVKDLYDITYKSHSFGNASAFRFYRQALQQVIIKLENLCKIDRDMIALFITPQFEPPKFKTEIITLAPQSGEFMPKGWFIRVWETREGYEYRARVERFIPRTAEFEKLAERPIYIIEIKKKELK